MSISSLQVAEPAHPFVLITGVIAGISIGVAILVTLVLCLLLWLIHHRKRAKEADSVAFNATDGQPFAEMEGHVFPELVCLESQPRDVASLDSGSILSTISEVGDGREDSIQEPIAAATEKWYPPPGWM
ncbi:hypothetical protein P153DRAFT_381721 [Dothidotthia symphoricarpi CBS 119687]|uniref:Uncharacterized protein n=1 Tax=Dothidotthia symphoricarpi CBS 119687 TaxID=1392245 RepID=A0A6A6AMS5_9PLEO|nr:uncharacterized protein P153DRAFT_381721 [Dothidotthia symphoricarpi CBS 119687]KAF2133282.1 hypothetical protein P153DRAFT_381721 [Dothidotthia symphoricarpi CBS 119687]